MTESHDIPLHAKAEVHRIRALDMKDLEVGPEDDGSGVLRSRHEQTKCFQRIGERGTYTHRLPYGPGESPMVRSAMEQCLRTAEAILAN